MPWHFAEQLACVRWARPERTFCTRARNRAATFTRPAPLAVARLQSRARPHPLARTLQGPRPPTAPLSGRPWQRAGGRSSLCHGRRRPSHSRAPARPWAARAYPRARPLVPVTATSSCRLQNGGSPAFLSTKTGTNLSGLYIALPIMPKLVSSLVRAVGSPPPPQLARGPSLPHLRQVRPPPLPGSARRNQSLPRPTSATIPFPSISRSHPTPQIRSGATVAQTPKSSRSHLRRGARRRRLPSPPPACRPPGGPPWTGGSIPALGTQWGAAVRRR